MSRTVNIHEAKTHLSRLLAEVQTGTEIIIAKAGKPVAKLIPTAERPSERIAGSAKGQFTIATEFNAPLPDDLLESFEPGTT
jgi:prevent-host-death family protein